MSVRELACDITLDTNTLEGAFEIGNPVIVEVQEAASIEALTVTENGTYELTEGIDGYAPVTVNVPEYEPITESLTATANGTYQPESGVDGFSDVTVAVPATVPEIEALTVTENGTYTASGDGFNPVTVDVPPPKPVTESLTVTENGTYIPDEGVDGFGSVVVNVVGDTFNPFPYLYNGQQLFRNQALPETVTLDFTGNTSISTLINAFRSTTGIKNLTIKGLTQDVILETFVAWSSIEMLTFEDCSFSPTTMAGWVRNTSIKAIYGEIDMTSCTNATVFFNACPNLEYFRFKANSISCAVSGFLSSDCPVTDDSLISFANGLDASAGQSIGGMHSNIKSQITAILGTNDNGTFVADANGTMTLTDFITSVKGWTIA